MDMSSQLTPALGSIPSAFAAACRQARTDSELFERCRDVLVQRFESDQIWFAINSGKSGSRRVGGADGFASAVQVGNCESGETQLLILASPTIAGTMRPVAMQMATGLSVVLELRSEIVELG